MVEKFSQSVYWSFGNGLDFGWVQMFGGFLWLDVVVWRGVGLREFFSRGGGFLEGEQELR